MEVIRDRLFYVSRRLALRVKMGWIFWSRVTSGVQTALYGAGGQ